MFRATSLLAEVLKTRMEIYYESPSLTKRPKMYSSLNFKFAGHLVDYGRVDSDVDLVRLSGCIDLSF